MKLLIRFISPFYVFLIAALFLYSYTQVDLSLTLSRLSVWQVIEKSFQYIGYFQRPLSTYFYAGILLLLFFAYSFLLVFIKKGKITRKTVWFLVVFTAILLTFSYNAFSYDLFNYIFDAKIITHYFQNPYTHMAFDFPHDPMLSFMHWTGRTYPYGPTWLLITVPVSFLGLQIFLPTFFLFKAIGSFSYLGICWCIEKILNKTDPKDAVFGLGIFAFSPLVTIEGLVSAHNDMAMVLLATLGMLFLSNKKYVRSFLLFVLSAGIKFATAMLLPVWLVSMFLRKDERNWQLLLIISFALMIVPVVFASFRTNFQPWYILFLFPFVALMTKRIEILVGYSVFSFAVLLQYLPFLYTGNWNPPIPYILLVMLWIGVASSFVTMFAVFLVRSVAKH